MENLTLLLLGHDHDMSMKILSNMFQLTDNLNRTKYEIHRKFTLDQWSTEMLLLYIEATPIS